MFSCSSLTFSAPQAAGSGEGVVGDGAIPSTGPNELIVVARNNHLKLIKQSESHLR